MPMLFCKLFYLCAYFIAQLGLVHSAGSNKKKRLNLLTARNKTYSKSVHVKDYLTCKDYLT